MTEALISAARQQNKAGTSEAMDRGRSFSWVKGLYKGKVQAGVYHEYSQEFWHQYKMK